MITTFKVILMIILVISFIGAYVEKGESGNKYLAMYISSLIALLITFFVW